MTGHGEHGHDDHEHEGAHAHEHVTYEEAIEAFRADKDAHFRDSADSPLLPEDRPRFTGISYFPPDASLRFEGLALEPAEEGDTRPFHMPTSDGALREARRIGRLRFTVAGRELRLHAYALPGSAAGDLFVPFLDSTSGHETYEAGRYLDLEPEGDGTYTLDFNLAYHPTCVFSPYYSCPLAPQENRLPVRIEAGERLTPGIGGH